MTTTNRINKCFKENYNHRQKLLITYFMAGDPSLAGSEYVISTAIEAGTDIVELGIPFTDPLADGPVIEQAGLRALTQGVNIAQVLDLTKRLRKKYDTPIVLMSYFNPIYKNGLANFTQQATLAGADGLIVPDLPFGEDAELFHYCCQAGIELIPIVVKSTANERLQAIGARKPAFIYCVSVNGTTGVRQNLNQDVKEFLLRVKDITGCPAGVGFGIGTGEQAAMVAPACDAVIVGSALVELVEKYAPSEELLAVQLTAKVRELKQAITDGELEVATDGRS